MARMGDHLMFNLNFPYLNLELFQLDRLEPTNNGGLVQICSNDGHV